MAIATIIFLVDGENVYLSEKKRGFGVGYLNGYGGKVADDEKIDALL